MILKLDENPQGSPLTSPEGNHRICSRSTSKLGMELRFHFRNKKTKAHMTYEIVKRMVFNLQFWIVDTFNMQNPSRLPASNRFLA